MVDVTTFTYGLAAAIGLAVATVGGFLAGYRSAVNAPARLLRRAGRSSDKCLIEATAAIDLAGRLCEAVANASTADTHHIEAIANRQTRLADAVSRLQRTRQASAAVFREEVEWVHDSLDVETELPDRSMFEANLTTLIGAAHTAARGGLMFVSIDDALRLRQRVGEAGFRNVCKSAGHVLSQAGRATDFTCRIDGDTFAVLMPDLSTADSLANANAVRDAFRNHPFRIGADGPECLVTASFGFTPVLPSDELRLITDRVRAAVTRSRTCGRNRLHAYEPSTTAFELIKPLVRSIQPLAMSAV